MKHLIGTLRAMAIWLAAIPPCPARYLGGGIVGFALWTGLDMAAPAMETPQLFCAAFAGGTGTGALLQMHARRRDLARIDPRGRVALVILALGVVVLGGFAFAAQPRLCQQVFALILLAQASVRLMDLRRTEAAIARIRWKDPDFDGLRRTLSGASILMYLALTLLSEHLARTVSLADWLVFWAVLPVIVHYLAHLLVDTIYLSRHLGR